MKGLVYKGTRKVAVEEVPDAKVQGPLDAVVRLTTTNICGSDLHMYEGRASVEPGTVLGHENMGVVEEVGPDRPDAIRPATMHVRRLESRPLRAGLVECPHLLVRGRGPGGGSCVAEVPGRTAT